MTDGSMRKCNIDTLLSSNLSTYFYNSPRRCAPRYGTENSSSPLPGESMTAASIRRCLYVCTCDPLVRLVILYHSLLLFIILYYFLSFFIILCVLHFVCFVKRSCWYSGARLRNMMHIPLCIQSIRCNSG
jgi:hypothetical protein